jgi:glycosyltransferase involved in cell wall biosynthesis
MRIAFLGPSYPWRGGIAQFANTLGEKLLTQGNEVMMFTFRHQYPALLFPASDQFDNTGQPIKLATQRILTPYNPFTWVTSIHDIKGWNPDVLIISYWLPFMAPSFGFILRLLKGIRKIYLIHNAESHEKWLFGNSLTNYAFKPVKEFVALSDLSVQTLLRTNKKLRVAELFHPVYEKILIHNGHNEEIKHNILFFGFVKHYKGLDVLLEAMPLVLKKIPQIKLTIAGDVYGDKSDYLNLIEKLGIKYNVDAHFNYIPDDELEKYFAGCDVCVIPYRTATQSGVVQMAFAYEKPVIATKVGGISEVVIDGENGFLVEPENPQALAEKIIYFYEHDFSLRFRSNIQAANQQYSWDSFTKQLLDFLN